MSVVDRLSALSPEQRALFEKLRQRQSQPATPRAPLPPPVERVSGPMSLGDWPMSFDQERLMKLHAEDPQMVSWNVDACSRIAGDLDVTAIVAGFREIARVQAAWRTTYPIVDGQPMQRVHDHVEPHVALIDLTALPAELREAAARAALFERTRALFDFENGPLVRATLVRLAAREHLCLVNAHHSVTDWITFQHCWRDLLLVYEAYRTGRPWRLPEIPVQFVDFAVWERRWLQGEVLEAFGDFWRKELEGFPPVLELPADHPRPAVQTQRGGMFRAQVGAEASERLRAVARREGATTFMAVLAVLAAVIRNWAGHEKMVLGSNSSGRARPELEPIYGIFLTQTPFAMDASGDPTYRELLQRARKVALRAYAFQNFPFSKLLEALDPPPDPSRFPVVQTMLLILEGHSSVSQSGLRFTPEPLYDGNSRWDLMFGLYDFHDVGLAGPVEYNADIFEPETIHRLMALFYRTVEAVGANPDLRLSELPTFAEVS